MGTQSTRPWTHEMERMKAEIPRVLLVDDDAGLLRLIAMRLGAAGFEVTAVSSGERALACLAVSRPQVVVTDLRMRGMDGLALFDAIYRQAPALPVVILTAHGTIPEAVAATRRGMYGFLTKPFDPAQLLETVAGAARVSSTGTSSGQSWRSEVITRAPAMQDLLQQAQLVAGSDAGVCVYGDDEERSLAPLDQARRAFERDYLVRILKITRGKVTQASRLAGRNRTEFYRLLERHGLEPSKFKQAG